MIMKLTSVLHPILLCFVVAVITVIIEFKQCCTCKKYLYYTQCSIKGGGNYPH